MKIEEVESQISRNLSNGLSLRDSLDKVGYVVPQQSQPRVTLSDANGRKKKRNASADNWSAESGQIVVRYEPVPQEYQQPSITALLDVAELVRERRDSGTLARQASGPSSGSDSGSPLTHGGAPQPEDRGRSEQVPSSNTFMHPAEAELLRALDRAESKPGWNFVPLKKFRDEILPTERPEYIPSLRTDVEQRQMLQSVIDKRFVLVSKVPNPKAPQFPVTTVRLNRLMPQVKVALGQVVDFDQEFRPIEIRGEPLSETILRERR